MKRLHPLLLSVASACLTAGTPALAQVNGRPLDPCPAARDVKPADLYGLWHFSLSPLGGDEAAVASRGAMLFEAHPEYPGSVRGQLRRSTATDEVQAHVSGDVTDGVFNLDESEDGVAMSAVWEGELSPTDCRLDIRGTRRAAEGRPDTEGAQRFRLYKAPDRREPQATTSK